MKKIILPILGIAFILLLFSACGENSKEITVNYVAEEGGAIEGEATQVQTVSSGDSATFSEVTAIPNEGYRFVSWSDGKTEANRTDTLNESTTLTAKFEKIPTVMVKYETGVGGRVVGETEQTVKAGEKTALVRALPLGGYRFVAWSDGLTTDSREDIASENVVYTAEFELIEYASVTYNAGQGGEIIGFDYQELEKGQTTDEVTASPLQGYRFVAWSDGVTTATRTDIAEGNVVVEAIFSNRWVVEYKAGEGGAIDGESTQSHIWGNTSKSVTAVPSEGYKFIAWSDGQTSPTRQDKVRDDKSYTAIFKRYYVVSYACDETKGTLDGALVQEVIEGENTVAVTATPNDGFEFVSWSNGVSTPTVVIEAAHDIELYAYFQYKSDGLPVISVDTENGVTIDSKENYFNCTITLNDTELGLHLLDVVAKIKGRGNSTWNFDYKPYKIKFEQKQNLFGYGEAKDWVLLANYGDISLIRNYIAYQTACNMSELSVSPDSQLVEVYVNGLYQGVYLLCEQVEANEHRVELNETYVEGAEDVLDVDTGYLIEMDEWVAKEKDGVYVVVNDNLVSTSLSDGKREYAIKFPDSDQITDAHLAFIKDYLERAIKAAEGDDYSLVTELIDVKSFAQMYLVAEIFKCPDVDYSSFYMYKDAGGKLTAGPVWDYDMAFANVAHKEAECRRYDYLWAKEANPWFNSLLNHEEFVSLVKNELKENEEVFNSTIESCYTYAYEHRASMEKCFEDRKTVTTFFTPSALSKLATWQEHMDQVKSFYENSMSYVKSVYLLSEAE